MRKCISIILVAILILTLCQTTILAFSNDAYVVINNDKSSTTVITYGGYQWYVIGYNGNMGGVSTETGTITLLAKDNVTTSRFRDEFQGETPINSYYNSDLRKSIDSTIENFSQAEINAIMPITLLGGSYDTAGSGMYGEDVIDTLFWTLDVDEANGVNRSLLEADFHTWLRSPGMDYSSAACIYKHGEICAPGYYVGTKMGVRPAIKLELSEILLMSDNIINKKGLVSENLEKVSKPNGVQKLTIIDNNRQNVEIEEASQSDMTVTISYNNATTGSGQFLSAIIKDNTGNIRYYGSIADTSIQAHGTATLKLPNNFYQDNLSLSIFSEQQNGENQTDYASSAIVIPVSETPELFIPVTQITNVPSRAVVGENLTLIGTVEPYNATNQTIQWNIKSQGTTEAILDHNILKAINPGVVTVTATIKNGVNKNIDYLQDFDINVIEDSSVVPPNSMYTVTFDSMGGSFVPDAEVEYDHLVSKPENPTKAGYQFLYWYSLEEDSPAPLRRPLMEIEWDFYNDTVYEDITLYAKWKEIDKPVVPPIEKHTVTFDSMGGTSVEPIKNVAENSLITEPTQPHKNNYIFQGWFKDKEYTNKWQFDSNKVNSNITLYAKWKSVNALTTPEHPNNTSNNSSLLDTLPKTGGVNTRFFWTTGLLAFSIALVIQKIRKNLQ